MLVKDKEFLEGFIERLNKCYRERGCRLCANCIAFALLAHGNINVREDIFLKFLCLTVSGRPEERRFNPCPHMEFSWNEVHNLGLILLKLSSEERSAFLSRIPHNILSEEKIQETKHETELSHELGYDEIRELALKLYKRREKSNIQPTDEELKIKGYWTKARLILEGRRKPPRNIPVEELYPNKVHLERLKKLLKWAEANEQIQSCLKRNAIKKAIRLIAEESIKRYNVGKKYANNYAKIIVARMKSKRARIQTIWGDL